MIYIIRSLSQITEKSSGLIAKIEREFKNNEDIDKIINEIINLKKMDYFYIIIKNKEKYNLFFYDKNIGINEIIKNNNLTNIIYHLFFISKHQFNLLNFANVFGDSYINIVSEAYKLIDEKYLHKYYNKIPLEYLFNIEPILIGIPELLCDDYIDWLFNQFDLIKNIKPQILNKLLWKHYQYDNIHIDNYDNIQILKEYML